MGENSLKSQAKDSFLASSVEKPPDREVVESERESEIIKSRKIGFHYKRVYVRGDERNHNQT